MSNERERLVRVYSAMSEGELEKLLEDAASLTEDARQILHEELQRRQMTASGLKRIAAEADAVPEYRELVTIRQFRDLPEALLAKGMLDSSRIESFLADDNIVRMDWFISNFIGGIKLRVRPEDVEAATEIFNQPMPEVFSFEGDSEFEQPTCPKCGSIEIMFTNPNKGAALIAAAVVAPLPIAGESWKCMSCGASWVDDGE